MERLVVDLEKITFQGDFQNKITENCSTVPASSVQLLKFKVKNCLPNMNMNCDEQMPEKRFPVFLASKDEDDTASETNSADNTISEDSCDDKIEDDNENDSIDTSNETLCHETNKNPRNLRVLPSRSSKANALTKRNLRIPMKPPRVSAKSTAKLSPSEIRKLYSNQKLTRFQRTKLETIFEEPQPVRSRAPIAADAQFRLIGKAKVRRSLTCTDGFHTNQTLIKQRRAKIKKTFGRRHTWKKIPLQGFLEHMQKSFNDLGENDDNKSGVHQSFLPNQNPLPNTIVEVVEESIGITED